MVRWLRRRAAVFRFAKPPARRYLLASRAGVPPGLWDWFFMRMSSAVPAPLSDEARARGSLKLLVELWHFVRPYGPQLAGALAALLVAAATVDRKSVV